MSWREDLLLVNKGMYVFRLGEIEVREYDAEEDCEYPRSFMYSLEAKRGKGKLKSYKEVIIALLDREVSDELYIQYDEDLEDVAILDNLRETEKIEEIIFELFGNELNYNPPISVFVGFVKDFYEGGMSEDVDINTIVRYYENVYEGIGKLYEVHRVF